MRSAGTDEANGGRSSTPGRPEASATGTAHAVGSWESQAGISRRSLLAAGAVAAGAASLGPGLVRRALAAPARAGAGPYGPLLAPDANGVQLPKGFSSRIVAQATQPVGGTLYTLPIFPDGQATFRTEDGGWILVTNSESVAASGAGVSATRFDSRGEITDAYRILGETNLNCAGGPTPWGTWLSGEETGDGMIWECDPAGVLEAEPRPLLGVFNHEAAAVDPVGGRLYLTEDDPVGAFYRFTPANYPSLDSGVLEAAVVGSDGKVAWHEVPDPTTAETGTRTADQVPGVTRFDGSEGIWYGRGLCFFTTKGDKRVWEYDCRTERLEVIFDREQAPDASLDAVDNVTVNALGDVFVCEDGGNLEIGLIDRRKNTVSPLIRLPGPEHSRSEIAGVCFDPSGTRMYFTSQRGSQVPNLPGPGTIFEVTGPFRLPKGGQPKDFVYGPPAGEARPNGPLNPAADKKAPKLQVSARKRIGARRLAGRGLPVRVSSNEPARLAFALRSTGFGKERHSPDTPKRPKSISLAESRLGAERIEMNQRSATIRLALGKRAKRKLRRRAARSRKPIPARLIAVAVDGAGNRRAVVRKLEIRP